ncbi:MAG: 2-dehydropantoate 2-reductase (Ketopantoate reductase) (KPA reductase) (KPR) [Geoglossum simile]|nr:MAG: 2-dehydropantoate 2-reductase (Ketopantoate reductase) (KPA reductase) (KPR) [Geoglossum simile]
MQARRQSLVCTLQCRPFCVSLFHRLGRSPPPHHQARPADPISVLGIGNIGSLTAHSLAKAFPVPPIVLLLQLLSEREEAGRCIDVVTDGSSDKQGGLTTEVVSQGNGSIIKHLVVATKTHATSAAIQPLKHRLSNESTILFFQNGIGI